MSRFNFIRCTVVLTALAIVCNAEPATSQTRDQPKLRVLGYLFSAGMWDTYMTGVDFTKITDLNLAFLNPDSTGNFPDNPGIHKVVERAHANKVRIFFSIGGGNPPVHLAKLLESDKRKNFISAIVQLSEKYGVDGVDVDIENDLINANYASFVSELAAAIKPKNKLLTAALATWNCNLIHDSTLRLYDYINIMSYDKTGPWTPNSPGPHSPYSMAQDDFNYFSTARQIAAEKLLIGLPFYGYGFGSNAPVSLSYKDIVSAYPGSENTDTVEVTGGGKIYYNGIPTIRQKVSFAINKKASGVMIWELLQDSNDSKSLLLAINAAINQ